MRVVVGSATFFDAFDALVIAFVLPVLIPLWQMSPAQVGLLVSSGYVGQVIGCILFGWVSNRPAGWPPKDGWRRPTAS
jgi:putative MFS transporter